MFKQAWRSYLASLHPRNIRKIKNIGFGIIWIWSLANSTVHDMANSDNAGVLSRLVIWLVFILPYFLMWWSNLGGRLPMPKQMYLLPMKLQERGKYIHTLLCIKIGFPLLVGLVLHIVKGIMYGMEPFRIIVCTFTQFSFGIGMYVCSSLRSKYDRYIPYAVRGEDGAGTDAFLNWMCMIYSMIYYSIVFSVEFSSDDTLFVIILLYTLGCLVMVIMDIAIIKTRYLWTIIDVCDYEESRNILGKVKNV